MKDLREKDDIVIEFNQDGLDKYLKQWQKKYPRKKKMPIEKPMVMSMNKLIVITNRIVQNNHKQNYKEYTEWVVKEHGLDMLGISKTDLHIHFVFDTKIRHDLDNFIGGVKMICDGFSDSGLIVDDDYYHIRSISATASYEKGVTKMIFTFKNCEYDKDELKISMEKERVKREKREEKMKEIKIKKKSKGRKKK